MTEQETISLDTSELRPVLTKLQIGDRILLSGVIYTARDAAHKRLFERLDRGEELPIPIRDSVIYYAGPTPAQQGMAVGACGPTTAGRMDRFAPRLLNMGLAAMIGKGDRSQAVEAAIRENGACYFAAVGGAGALIAQCIQSAEVVAFEDLGCESIKKLIVKDFPVTVAIDCRGGNRYKSGRALYQQI
ncbi:MAG: Fe-S-containing hydro-lyase [Intestinimonas sp.]|jgi:fumarate hydratase subunit beta|nr:Fe-S-containing hydro-lyase [Intestinimonas sp.]